MFFVIGHGAQWFKTILVSGPSSQGLQLLDLSERDKLGGFCVSGWVSGANHWCNLTEMHWCKFVQVYGASAQDPGAMVHASDVSGGKNKDGVAAPF